MNPNFFGISKVDPAGHCRHWWTSARACQDARRQGELSGVPEGADLRIAIIVPGLVIAEVDYFLRDERKAMRKPIAEIFDPATRYEYRTTSPLRYCARARA
jgi:hypothetical protein